MNFKLLVTKFNLTLFFLIASSNYFVSIAATINWQEKSNSYDKEYTLQGIGTCYEQTSAVPIYYNNLRFPGQPKLLGAYENGDKRYSEYCAKLRDGLKILDCGITSCDYKGYDTSRGFFIKNNEGYGAGIELWKELTSNEYKGGDSGNLKSTYAECKTANPNSIAGFNGNDEYKGHYATVEACKTALLESYRLPTEQGIKTTGMCQSASADNKILDSGNRTTRYCNCAMHSECTSVACQYQKIYYTEGPSSEIKVYWEGISTSYTDEIKIAAINCLAEHPTKKYFNEALGGCYDSIDSCTEIICDKDTEEGKYFNPVTKAFVEFSEIVKAVKNGSISPDMESEIRRCSCSTEFNIKYNYLFCSVGLTPPGGNCEEACKLLPINLEEPQPVKPQSPLAIINTLVNLLFWLAVVLFIVNFITSGIEMIRSGDEPEKMKEATERISSSIFGFIFILIISGLINYLIDFVEAFLTKTS